MRETIYLRLLARLPDDLIHGDGQQILARASGERGAEGAPLVLFAALHLQPPQAAPALGALVLQCERLLRPQHRSLSRGPAAPNRRPVSEAGEAGEAGETGALARTCA
eukprot:4428841-Pyramimonas_sp.AAC.1